MRCSWRLRIRWPNSVSEADLKQGSLYPRVAAKSGRSSAQIGAAVADVAPIFARLTGPAATI